MEVKRERDACIEHLSETSNARPLPAKQGIAFTCKLQKSLYSLVFFLRVNFFLFFILFTSLLKKKYNYRKDVEGKLLPLLLLLALLFLLLLKGRIKGGCMNKRKRKWEQWKQKERRRKRGRMHDQIKKK